MTSTILEPVARTDLDGFWISSTPTCSTRRSCPRSACPSQAGRRSTSSRCCSPRWSATRRPSAWRSRGSTPRSTSTDRQQAGWWSSSARHRGRLTTCPASLTSSGPRAAPARTRRARSGLRKRCAPPDCLLSSRHGASTVNDRGDVPGFRWRIDPENPRAMNADAAADVARVVADQAADSCEGARRCSSSVATARSSSGRSPGPHGKRHTPGWSTSTTTPT